MIPLTDLCVSRELAERMAKLGFEQETRFTFWRKSGSEKWYVSFIIRGDLPAPTSAEIELPNDCVLFKNKNGYTIGISLYGEYDGTSDVFDSLIQDRFSASTEAEAKGLMWCYLKENKMI